MSISINTVRRLVETVLSISFSFHNHSKKELFLSYCHFGGNIPILSILTQIISTQILSSTIHNFDMINLHYFEAEFILIEKSDIRKPTKPK